MTQRATTTKGWPVTPFLGIAAAIVLLMLSGGAGAQLDTWTTSGPSIPRNVDSIAISPHDSRLLFASSVSLFRSADAGATWTRVDLGLTRVSRHAIAFDSADTNIVYAGTDYGFYRSIDQGRSFQLAAEGLPSQESQINDLASHPDTPGILYAAADSLNVIYRSNDAGVAWIPSANGVPYDPGGDEIVSISIVAEQPSTMYAGHSGGTIYKSTTAGAEWGPVGELPEGDLRMLAADPQDPELLYAVAAQTLYKSDDGGATLRALSIGPGILPSSLAFDRDGERLYAGTANAGVFVSSDRGEQWEPKNDAIPFAYVRDIAVDPAAADTLAIGVRMDAQLGGVFRSTNGGETWLPASEGLPQEPIDAVAIAVDPQSTNNVYTLSNRGIVFKSVNAGQSWSRSDSGLMRPPPDRVNVQASLVITDDPSRIYLAAIGGVYRSDDAAAHWMSANEGLPSEANPLTIAFDPVEQTTLYTTVDLGESFKSVDGGEMWQRLGGRVSPPVVVIAPDDPNTLYGLGITRSYRSNDAGARWEPFVGPIGFPPALVISPSAPATFFALASGFSPGTTFYKSALIRSRDRGATWTTLLENLVASAIAVHPREPDTVWITSDDFGAARSTDAGETFAELSDGLQPFLDTEARGIALDPEDPNVAYLATEGGVFRIRASRQNADTCAGDCSQDQAVTVDEIVVLVNIALGLDEVSACAAGDIDSDNAITINEIVAALNHAISGCSGA